MKQLLLFLGLFFVSTTADARDYSITQITNIHYNQYSKINSRGDVVWAAKLNTTDLGWTVFLYNAATKTSAQISAGPVYFNSHDINSQGDVVWTQYDGNDQEVFLYQSSNQKRIQISDNSVEDRSARISDTGDISWISNTETGARIMRYEAASLSSRSLDLPDASRQGLNSIASNGNICWNAEIGGDQEVILYDAATDSIRNLSDNDHILDSNQLIMDNGDVVWNAYNLLTFDNAIMYYKASTETTRRLSEGGYGFTAYPTGTVAWVRSENDKHTLSTFSTKTETITDIAQQTSQRPPSLFGISARGDVIWRSIVGADYVNWVYNAQTKETLDLARGSGVFDLVMAGNGDVLWSLWDGISDFEIFSYQATSGTITQLTNNNVNDGIIFANAAGSLVWTRFYNNAWNLFTAVKKPLSLRFKVDHVDVDITEPQISVALDFTSDGVPDFTETVSVSVNGIDIASAPLGDFDSAHGVHVYQSKNTTLELDFNTGKALAWSKNTDIEKIISTQNLDVALGFGAASASDTFLLEK